MTAADGRLDNTYRYYCVCQNERQTIRLRTNAFRQNRPFLLSNPLLLPVALPVVGNFVRFGGFRRGPARLADVPRKSIADRNCGRHIGEPALAALDLQDRESGKILSSDLCWQRLRRLRRRADVFDRSQQWKEAV